MLKKYNHFLKESKELYLYESIILSTENSPSFSDLCKKEEDPNYRFKLIQSRIDNDGWTLEKIRNEYSDSDLISLYKSLSSINGYVDLYFYKLFENFGLDKNIVELGGYGWSDINVSDDEAFIRYSYGYHTTEYGIMSLNQIKGGTDKFLENLINYLKNWISEDISKFISKYTHPFSTDNKQHKFSHTDLHKGWKTLDINSFIIYDDDRIIVLCSGISDFLNNIKEKEYNESDINIFRPDDIYLIFKKFLFNISINNFLLYIELTFTGFDLIISFKLN
jgi:hypothetical protein